MTVYVSADALNSISRVMQTARSIETGGILLGKDLKNGDMLITHAIGPGPNSIKQQCVFRKDFDYSVKMLNVLYSRYSVDFIGDWHKHPTCCVNYSATDFSSMIKITNTNKKQCFFIIVGDDYDQINNNLALYTVEINSTVVNKIPFVIVQSPETVACNIGFKD